MVKSLFLLNPAGLSYRAQYLRETLTHLTWKKFRLLYPGLMRAYPYTGIPLASPVLRRSLYRLLKNDAVRNFVKLLNTEDFVDGKLGKIKAPCQVLWGKEDRLISEKTPYTLLNEIPNCTAFHVEKCAHVLCLEAPLNVYDALLNFYGITEKSENHLTKLLRISSKSYKQTALQKKETGAFNECN
jgi:pimeloyl-ACP methyl ester carboxylesterase